MNLFQYVQHVESVLSVIWYYKKLCLKGEKYKQHVVDIEGSISDDPTHFGKERKFIMECPTTV